MKTRIIAGYAALLLAASISTASAEQQWDCKYHIANTDRPGTDFPFKLIENATSLDAHLDDLAGMVTHFKIIQNSKDGLIAVIPELPNRLSLQAFLLDKRKGDMKMTLTFVGPYEENYLGKCTRPQK